MDIRTATATKILAIPMDQPELIFSGDPVICEREYKRLASKFHPDTNPDVPPGVFAHISVLYSKALKKLDEGTWSIPGLQKLTDKKGRKYEIYYQRAHKFELGTMYIGDDHVAYVIEEQFKDLVGNAQRLLKSLDYKNASMRKEYARYLPADPVAVALKPSGYLIIFGKKPEQLLLRDVLDHYKGKIPPKHVAWILSSLYNLKCYLNYAGIVHHDISPDTYFIDPKDHNGVLIGGWWYSSREGSKLRALPQRTVKFGPAKLVADKRAVHNTDADLIRVTGRELLGDIHGTRLLTDKDVPSALSEYLRMAGKEDSAAEYKRWSDDILKKAFGARRYTEMPVNSASVYK